ncbi:MAG: hypothetical protein N4A44_00440 [Alphaproteobacteria bacterium]|jgi:hypothetical protein|nr:hypothetical protein [Alphaproteobacteria bacterium]
MKTKVLLSLIALSVTTTSNDAEAVIRKNKKRVSGNSDITLGIGAGTTGYTGEIGYRNKYATTMLGRHVGFRFNYNTFDDTIEDFEIDGEEFKEVGIDTKTQGALIDFYLFNEVPILRNIRISGGYYWGDMDGHAIASVDNLVDPTINIGGTEYTLDPGAEVSSVIDYDLTGPYAGIGYQSEILWGLGLTIDAGIIFLDKDANDVMLSGTGTANGGSVDLSSEIDAQLAQEEKNIKEDLPEDFFPVVRVGLSYRF